ncbi:MAG: XdhC family protein [Desulfobacterales bacterium]|nr:XdhC family protein [Desulfobacterales bacterium]
MKELAERICDLLENGSPAAVATILRRSGSAPRTAGSKMVVDEHGGFVGTIGGGKFEADVLAEAGRSLAEARPKKMFFDLTSDDVSAMDMICGGQMEVLVDYLAPEDDATAVFAAWKSAMEEKKAGSLVTIMRANASWIEKTDHCVVFADEAVAGGWPLSSALLKRVAKTPSVSAVSQVIDADDVQLLVEPTIAPKTVLIFGAGHVSMPTARLAGEVGFRVVVVDDRKAFANRDRFPGADQILVPEDFAAALTGLAVDADTFVVIVTRGHRYDKEVLSQVLSTGAGYIGMIGSRKKRDAIYAALKKEGVAEDDLARVHCPIGLSIGAESPAEIAVSIVGELIACRAGIK